MSKFSQYRELKCGLLKHWICSLVLRLAVSLPHSFILVLLTEHLLCASTVLDTGNRAMKETDGAHVLMELTPGMLHVVLDSGQCRQDINLGTSGMGYRL